MGRRATVLIRKIIFRTVATRRYVSVRIKCLKSDYFIYIPHPTTAGTLPSRTVLLRRLPGSLGALRRDPEADSLARRAARRRGARRRHLLSGPVCHESVHAGLHAPASEGQGAGGRHVAEHSEVPDVHRPTISRNDSGYHARSQQLRYFAPLPSWATPGSAPRLQRGVPPLHSSSGLAGGLPLLVFCRTAAPTAGVCRKGVQYPRIRDVPAS